MKSHSTASARLPDFVEPMKAKLVEGMQPGNWITGSLLSSFTVPSQRSRRGAKRYSGRKHLEVDATGRTLFAWRSPDAGHQQTAEIRRLAINALSKCSGSRVA